LKYDDTAVLPQTLYVYRVFAVGVAGRSLPSNEVAVVSPSPAPVTDTTAPRVTIVTPPRNARVSGVVRVVASASDNVGVVRMNISTTSGTVLRAVDGASLTYDWNTSRLRRGSTQTLIVRAWDAANNVGTASVVVRIAR
jgi:chitodextrinase